MKQTALEWYAEQMQLKEKFTKDEFNDIFEQAKIIEKQQEQQKCYTEQDLSTAWHSSEQNMRFQFSSSAYKGIMFDQWLRAFKNE